MADDHPPLPLPPSIGAPAARALTGAGCTDLRDVARLTGAQLRALHGVGPRAVERLRAAMAEHGLAVAAD